MQNTTHTLRAAIVGRPNVGKSTLFNRLVGRRQAIVAETGGVTRDRIYGAVEWGGACFEIIDTGGVDLAEKKGLGAAIQRQMRQAVAEATVVLFVVDGRAGPHPLDDEIRRLLFASGKTVFLVVNKIDDPTLIPAAGEFFGYGAAAVFFISAQHGLAIDDLLDALTAAVSESADSAGNLSAAPECCRIAVIGKPNVGKSSLLNALLQRDRVIVDAVAGTTRDSVETSLVCQGQAVRLIDTAGIRLKKKMQEHLDVFSRARTIEAVRGADVCVVVVDAAQPLVNDDIHILSVVREINRPCVVAVNKIDLMPMPEPEFRRVLRQQAAFMDYALITTCSAVNGTGVERVIPAALRAWDNSRRKIDQAQLNDFLAQQRHNDKLLALCPGTRVAYLRQLPARPPAFVLIATMPQQISPAVLRYIERLLREAFPFQGTPLRIAVKKKERR